MKSTEQTSIYKKKEKEKRNKRKPSSRLITKEQRTKKRRERITSCESPSPRLVEKRTTKERKQLINRTIQVLKSPPIAFRPQRP